MDKNNYSYTQNVGKRKAKWENKKKAKASKNTNQQPGEELKVEEDEDKPLDIRKVLPSVDEILRKTQLMPRVFYSSLAIFTEPIASKNLIELLNVSCIHENVLLYGRYRKTDR